METIGVVLTMKTRFALLLSLLACSASGFATPMIMTFDQPFGDDRFVYTENGITATGKLGYLVDGAQHMDALGPGAASIDFTTGATFVATSLLLQPMGSAYCAFDCASRGFNDPIDYIWFSGFLDGTLMGSFSLYRPASTEFELISLSTLGIIDMLRVEAKYDLGSGLCDTAAGCGHFNIDNVTLTSVPEPGMFALLLAGLALSLRLRKRAA